MDVRIEFPDCDKEGYFYHPRYHDLVARLGDIQIETSDSDYQGDSFFLLTKDNKFGYLSFSWGSCSGCDILQACDSYEDLQSLADRLENQIIWFYSWDEIKDWVNARDWESLIDWHTGAKKFIKEFREYPVRAFR